MRGVVVFARRPRTRPQSSLRDVQGREARILRRPAPPWSPRSQRPVTTRGARAPYIDDLLASGRITFTREEATLAVGVNTNALKQSVLRLAARQRVVSARRGLDVIVALEHR